ncbi:MAG: IPT/TIG domain-containing protein [candidate division Zixibacteria bacterium]|nr:IPT/TIG domain-containing protein [candidate division Zixibacteria bacterium]
MRSCIPRSLLARLCLSIGPLLGISTVASSVHAQGNIYGVVQGTNLVSPPATDLFWMGFLNHSDQEIRIETNTGAGYDGTNWFDDFQNYTSHAAGIPYDYFFVNVSNGQALHLSKTVPANSFQQENILLAAGSFPARPAGLVAQVTSARRINLSWNSQPGMTCHVYRRVTSNAGVFRRIDDPLGSLANLGVADSFFVDSTSDGISDYTYVLIAQNSSGNFSAHSATSSALASVANAPAVAAVMPDSGAPAGGYSVTICGTNFDVAGASVTFRGIAATDVAVQSPVSLTCTVPAGSPGFAGVVVTNTSSGVASSPLTTGFHYEGQAFTRGDVNLDGSIDVFDSAYLIEFIFSGGPSPLPVDEAGNVDGDPDHIIDVFDLVYLLEYTFSGGPAPPP